MSRALIIVGHELQAHEEAESYYYFLRKHVGIKLVKQVSAWNKASSTLLAIIANQCHLAGRQPLLIVYIGHGAKDGWAYGKFDAATWLELSYAKLADALAVSRRGPTLIVNDCCHAAALASAFCERDDECTDVGVISGSTEKGVTYTGSIGTAVLTAWGERRPFEPRKIDQGPTAPPLEENRWGAELDHHFFAKS